MNTSRQPAIFFHVGLGKVASTYLQYRFFPKLNGIRYIQRTRYRKAPAIIEQEKAFPYLVSREFDRQLPQEVAWFSGYFRDVQPIILLRRHDEWIASQYRRYLKNGGNLPLSEFLDLKHDQGRWKQAEVRFMPYIQTLAAHFDHPPLVYFHADFKADPGAFFEQLATAMGVSFDPESLDLRPFHASYADKQLRFMRKYGSAFFRAGRTLPRNPWLRWLKRRSEMLASYALLYSSILLPEDWVKDVELYPADQLQAIRDFYQDDWEACLQYAGKVTQ